MPYEGAGSGASAAFGSEACAGSRPQGRVTTRTGPRRGHGATLESLRRSTRRAQARSTSGGVQGRAGAGAQGWPARGRDGRRSPGLVSILLVPTPSGRAATINCWTARSIHDSARHSRASPLQSLAGKVAKLRHPLPRGALGSSCTEAVMSFAHAMGLPDTRCAPIGVSTYPLALSTDRCIVGVATP